MQRRLLLLALVSAHLRKPSSQPHTEMLLAIASEEESSFLTHQKDAPGLVVSAPIQVHASIWGALELNWAIQSQREHLLQLIILDKNWAPTVANKQHSPSNLRQKV